MNVSEINMKNVSKFQKEELTDLLKETAKL